MHTTAQETPRGAWASASTVLAGAVRTSWPLRSAGGLREHAL